MRLTTLAFLMLCASPLPAGEITVFAAASTRDALGDAARSWEAETGHRVRISPAGSSVLARQIGQGAPADLYLSAHPDWMDWLEARDLIRPETRVTLFGNALVIVGHGPETGAAAPELTPASDLLAPLGPDGRLAMALLEAVPAGLYGKAGLQALGLWETLAPRVAEADNVRAALALVALGEAPLGVVYATDASAEDDVHVVARFPAASHPPIRYPAAVTRKAAEPDLARAFLDWLGGATAQAIFARHGFVPPPE